MKVKLPESRWLWVWIAWLCFVVLLTTLSCRVNYNHLVGGGYGISSDAICWTFLLLIVGCVTFTSVLAGHAIEMAIKTWRRRR